MRKIALAFLALAFAAPAEAAHYVSLKSDKVFLREGPTYKHRVLFVYQRKGYPLEVLAAYDSWRRVRDSDGAVGWISQTMLSDLRTVLVLGKARADIRSGIGPSYPVVAKADPGVVARLKACKPRFCQVTAGGVTGWIEKDRIWGVSTGEIID